MTLCVTDDNRGYFARVDLTEWRAFTGLGSMWISSF